MRARVWLLLFLLTACGRSEPEYHRQLFVFGTLVDIQAYAADPDAFNQAVQAVQGRFQQMHEDWHAWKGNGKLMRLNQAFATGQCVQADTELVDILRQARLYEHESSGMFNPAIGRLVSLWGFHTDDFPIERPPPAQQDILNLVRQRPSLKAVRQQGGRLCSDNPAVAVDLGGFAKGLAVDEALEILARHGIRHAIVNAGGDLRVAGRHGHRNWRVAIRDPGDGKPLATIEARDGEAIFTSGNYYRYLAHAGKRYAHILDPRTGYPVREIQSATVIADSGALADAAATALVVAGTSDWLEVARGLGLTQVMLVTEDGSVYLTPEMKARVSYLNPPRKERIQPL